MNRLAIWATASLAISVLGCERSEAPGERNYVKLSPEAIPAESYELPPERAIDPDAYLFGSQELTSFYDAPGEFGYFMLGEEYGFDSLSIVITETHPHGGPPLHTHDVEEAHVLLSGRMDYVIGDQRFSATAPYIAKVPAGAPHTFVNAGDEPINLIGILPSNAPGIEVIGPNPLAER